MEIDSVKHYAATKYCILCRYMILDASGVELGCVFQANKKSASCQNLRKDTNKTCLGGTKHVIFSYNEEGHNQAYCYHVYCWEYVAAKRNDDITADRLLRFAQSSTQLFCLPKGLALGSVSAITDVASHPGPSDKNFEVILRWFEEKLPPELKRMILDYAGACPTSSILNIIYAGTVDLLQRVVLEPNWKIKCPIARYMTFEFVFIENSWLWCGCTTDNGVVGYRGQKSIAAEVPSDATIVRFTIGHFGIQGLQFRGPCGASIHIGEMISSNTLQYLLLDLDGLKVRNLEIDNRQKPFGHQFMWKGEIPLSASITINSKAYYQKKSWHYAEYDVSGYPGMNLIKHLPLLKPNSVLYGITIYCTSAGGITGLESHFRCGKVVSSSSIGRKIGVAIYFGLADSEYFDSAWVLSEDIASLLGPFLMLRTNKNRTACFRPLTTFYFTPKNLHTGRISGIYCDALRERYEKLESFGVMYDPKETIIDSSEPIVYRAQQHMTRLTAPPPGTFASKIVIEDMCQIRVCYRSDRCTGMTFAFANGSVEVLGQWLECTGRHNLLFDVASDKSFIGLVFELDGLPYNAVVRKVTLLTADTRITRAGAQLQVAKYYDTVEWIHSACFEKINIWR